MKILTLEKIKAQLRLDCIDPSEKSLLISYGESAEDTLFNILGRTYDEVVETYGGIPAPLDHAARMLVDVSYQYRSPVSQQNLSSVPYTFDLLVKPYMKL